MYLYYIYVLYDVTIMLCITSSILNDIKIFIDIKDSQVFKNSSHFTTVINFIKQQNFCF